MNQATGDRILDLVGDVAQEVVRAMKKHPPEASLHGAYGVLLEESDELWDEIKRRETDLDKVYTEAIQVAASAVRLVHDTQARMQKTFGVTLSIWDRPRRKRTPEVAPIPESSVYHLRHSNAGAINSLCGAARLDSSYGEGWVKLTAEYAAADDAKPTCSACARKAKEMGLRW